MQPQKNLTDLFRSSADRLEETPSERTWLMLERKLAQGRQPRPLTLGARTWSMAAGWLLLVGVLALLGWLLARPAAEVAVVATPNQWEELPRPDLPLPSAGQVALLHERYQHSRIEEGTASGKIVVRSHHTEVTE